MTTIPVELLPCPFCGDVPELPSGDGTQYEIECGGCGQAMASVQICDLMTVEERAADSFTNYRYAEEFVERAKHQAVKNWNLRPPLAEQPQAGAGQDVPALAVRLVPADPTPEMLEAGDGYMGTPATYKAMLSAAPHGISTEFSQFLAAVMDAAGLVRHGRQSKELSEYLGSQCMKYRYAAAITHSPKGEEE